LLVRPYYDFEQIRQSECIFYEWICISYFYRINAHSHVCGNFLLLLYWVALSPHSEIGTAKYVEYEKLEHKKDVYDNVQPLVSSELIFKNFFRCISVIQPFLTFDGSFDRWSITVLLSNGSVPDWSSHCHVTVRAMRLPPHAA